MQRAFAVLFVVIGVVAAIMFGSAAASAQDGAAAGAADLFTPTPTPAPTLAPAIQPDARLAVVGPDAADLWNRAGTEKQATLPAGTLLTAVGRSADGQWLYVYQTDESDPTLAAIHGSDAIVVDAAVLPLLDANAVPDILPVRTVHVNPETAPTPGSAAITVSAPITAEVNAGNAQLNVRSGPGTGYPVVAKVPTGTVLPVLGRNDTGDWVEVTTSGAGGSIGWVSSAYVGLSQPAGALPVVVPTNLPAPGQAPTATLPAYGSSQIVAPGSQPGGTAGSTVHYVSTQANTAQVPTAQASTAGMVGLAGTLVFQAGNGGMIYAYDLASKRQWPLAPGYDPAISPDGKSVVFARDGGDQGLYLVNIDGSNSRLIFNGRSQLSSPKWSPDGNWILFTRADESYSCRDLGHNNCVTETEMKTRYRRLNPNDYPLVTKSFYKLAAVDPSGQNYHDIATLNVARAADWNAGGIVYQSPAGLQITADAPNAANRELLFEPLQPIFHDPAWQPNGGKVAAQQTKGSHTDIYTLNADGSGLTALTSPVTTLVDALPSNVAPAWSPDGKHLVYLSNRDTDNAAGAWHLWVMNADGSNQRQLPITTPIAYNFGDEQVVSWGQ
jgi:hypothetical protein